MLAKILAAWSALKSMSQDALTGEPLRFITYGADAVVFVVLRAAVYVGYLPEAPNMIEIQGAVTVAIALVTELARRYVWSPASIQAAVLQAATDAVGQIPAPPASPVPGAAEVPAP